MRIDMEMSFQLNEYDGEEPCRDLQNCGLILP
jgi:hypothetical protein